MVAFEDRNAELPKLTIDISSAELTRDELDFHGKAFSNFTSIQILAE